MGVSIQESLLGWHREFDGEETKETLEDSSTFPDVFHLRCF